jgi:hypothetical protein
MTANPERVPAEQRREPFWWNAWARARVRENNTLAHAGLVIAALCIVGQLWSFQHEFRRSLIADESPVEVTALRPVKSAYHPGEAVRFRVSMRTMENDLLLFTLDSFVNQDSGEVYPGAMLVHTYPKAGASTRTAVRILPPRMAPGRYILEGWASPQTSRRTMSVGYQSLPFSVTMEQRQ